MLYITMALYCEAHGFIEKFKLKKDTASHLFPIFRSDRVTLLITKPGAVNAAMAVTWLFTYQKPSSKDCLINIGSGGTANKTIAKGSAFLGNKIVETSTGRVYFPDVLCKHPFCEAAIITEPLAAVSERDRSMQEDMAGQFRGGVCIYEMEAAGIYQSAGLFMQMHQIYFIKIVSDYLDGAKITPIQMESIIMTSGDCIVDFIKTLEKLQMFDSTAISIENQVIIHEIAVRLKMSDTMAHQLKQLLHYYCLKQGSGIKIDYLLEEVIHLPVKTKLEGKYYLEKLKKQLV